MTSTPDDTTTMERNLKQVTIYTDGACLGNPGPGGYGVVLLYAGYRKELSGGFLRTTNNRMELLAAIEGLAALKEDCTVTLVSDSEYVVKAMSQGWARQWRKSGWKRGRNERVVNPDLWARLLGLCQKHQVEFLWVKGHNGEPENERCDTLANFAASRADLQVDAGYEATRHSHAPSSLFPARG